MKDKKQKNMIVLTFPDNFHLGNRNPNLCNLNRFCSMVLTLKRVVRANGVNFPIETYKGLCNRVIVNSMDFLNLSLQLNQSLLYIEYGIAEL